MREDQMIIIKKFDQITETIEKRELYYVLDFKYNLIDSTLEMSFCENPDNTDIELKIKFHNISDFRNKRYHDPGDRRLAEIQNYDFEENKTGVKIRIETGDSMLEFMTLANPDIELIAFK